VIDKLPKMGDKKPWKVEQNYFYDRKGLRTVQSLMMASWLTGEISINVGFGCLSFNPLRGGVAALTEVGLNGVE
jgi:hypothetical protein